MAERKTPEYQLRAGAKYDATHTKKFGMKLNLNTDADIIARLEEVGAIQTYIKRLIREDIERERNK